MTNPAASNNEILAITKIGVSIVGMQVQAPAIARIHVTVTYFLQLTSRFHWTGPGRTTEARKKAPDLPV